MKALVTVDPVVVEANRYKSCRRLAGRSRFWQNFYKIHVVYLFVYFAAVAWIFWLMLSSIRKHGVPEVSDAVILIPLLAMLCMIALMQLRSLRNVIRTKGRSSLVSKIVPGLNSGEMIVELTDDGVQMDMRLKSELVGWNAITDVFDDGQNYLLSAGYNLVVMLPKTDDITAFLRARGFEV